MADVRSVSARLFPVSTDEVCVVVAIQNRVPFPNLGRLERRELEDEDVPAVLAVRVVVRRTRDERRGVRTST